MWVLILTIAYGHGNGHAAIDHVPGFPTAQSCLAAGNAWAQQLQIGPRAKAICVYSGKKE